MPTPTAILTTHRPALTPYEELYRHLHAQPDLSLVEHATCALIRSHLEARAPSFTVHAPIGDTGLAAVCSNGSGPTVLLRADTDGLPIREETGLSYASERRMSDRVGKEQPTMHACGHDMHVSALLGSAQLLHAARGEWSGTVVLVFQPAEEIAKGARAMVEGGLYGVVPVPDVVFGAHVVPLRSGVIGTKGGVVASAADSWLVRIRGRGGHASAPQRAVDPVVVCAAVVGRLQTIVSREMAPTERAVVSVTSIHAGEAENVIPESAEMKVNVRTYDEGVRRRVLSAIKRIVQAECDASGVEKAVEYEEISSFPLTDNDESVTKRLSEGMKAHFGNHWDGDMDGILASEDFPILATSVKRPYCYFFYGGVDPETWDRHEMEGTLDKIPSNHSAFFAPVIQPTMRCAVDGYAVAALTWLAKNG